MTTNNSAARKGFTGSDNHVMYDVIEHVLRSVRESSDLL